MGEWLGSTLAVYGNGNIHLYQYEPDYVSTPSVSGPSSGDIGTSYTFSASSTDPYGQDIRYTFDWGDGSQTVTGYYSSGAIAYASHSWSSAGVYSVAARAQCRNSARWSSWSSPTTINIGNQLSRLTVYAYSQYGYPMYVPLYIDSNYVGTTGYTYYVTKENHLIGVPSSLFDGYCYYDFQYYYYDGNYDGSNPITLAVTSDKTVEAYYYIHY